MTGNDNDQQPEVFHPGEPVDVREPDEDPIAAHIAAREEAAKLNQGDDHQDDDRPASKEKLAPTPPPEKSSDES